MTPQQVRQLWPIQTVSTVVGRGKSRTYADVRNGTFPPPIKDGSASRWLSDEVEAMRDHLIACPNAVDDERREFVKSLIAKRPTPQKAAA